VLPVIEPTQAQRSTLAAMRETLGILTFLAPTDETAGARHLARSARAVADAGGTRLLTLSIDQVLAGPVLSFRAVALDEFTDGGSALQAWDAYAKDLAATMSDVHALVLRLDRMVPRVTRTLSRFHRLLRWFAHIDPGREVDAARVLTPARIHSTPEQLDALLQGDLSEPFFNLNLTKFKGGEAGRAAVLKRVYHPSGRKLMALGGHAAAGGDVAGTFVGAPGEPLDDAWNDVAIAAWPSREVFRTYLANVTPEVADARKELLERSIQLVCSSVDTSVA
jgi:hypothetical protein